MKVTIKIEGQILTKRERIQCELDLPKDWKPSFPEFCKVIGAIRVMTEKLQQEFTPPPSIN